MAWPESCCSSSFTGLQRYLQAILITVPDGGTSYGVSVACGEPIDSACRQDSSCCRCHVGRGRYIVSAPGPPGLGGVHELGGNCFGLELEGLLAAAFKGCDHGLVAGTVAGFGAIDPATGSGEAAINESGVNRPWLDDRDGDTRIFKLNAEDVTHGFKCEFRRAVSATVGCRYQPKNGRTLHDPAAIRTK